MLAPTDYEAQRAIVTKYLDDPATIGGRDRLFNHVRKTYSNISRRTIAKVLFEDAVHAEHRPNKKRSTLRQVIVSGPYVQMQVDLIDLQPLSGYNSGTRYLLTTIDCFSKYCAVRPLPNKTMQTVTRAMLDILDCMPAKWRPRLIQSDRGAEFQSQWQNSLHERGIKTIQSSAYSPQSQGQIEKFNRTLKTAIFAIMDRQRTKRYVDFLPALVNNINTSVHTTTNYTPIELMEKSPKEAVDEIHARMQDRVKHSTIADYTYDIGDYVRVALTADSAVRKDKFRKKINKNWSSVIYQIYSISRAETAGSQQQYLLYNCKTKRNSLKRYYNYQLELAPQYVESSSDESDNEPVPRSAPIPIPARIRIARYRAPSATALDNIASNQYY